MIAAEHAGRRETPSAADLEAAVARALPLIVGLGIVVSGGLVLVLRRLGWLAEPRVRARDVAPVRYVAWAAAAAFACVLGQVALTALLHAAGHEVEEQAVVVRAFREGGVLMWISFVLGAPLGEELLFRRVVFAQMAAVNGRALAYLVATALFALAHMNPTATVNYLWIGVCCAYAFERTGRISAAILVHAVNNGVGLAWML